MRSGWAITNQPASESLDVPQPQSHVMRMVLLMARLRNSAVKCSLTETSITKTRFKGADFYSAAETFEIFVRHPATLGRKFHALWFTIFEFALWRRLHPASCERTAWTIHY